MLLSVYSKRYWEILEVMKKIIALVLSLFSLAAVFSGCNLVTTNTAKVLASTVAEVVIEDHKIKITREQLLVAYNNYGADLVQNNNSTVENAVKSTIDLLINRELILYQAKKVITPSEAQEQKVWKETYETLNKNLADYESEVKADEGIVLPTNPEEENAEVTLFNEFKPEVKLELVNGKYVLTKVEAEEEELQVEEGFVSGVEGFTQVSTNPEIGKKAMRRYLNQLKRNEKEKNLSIVDAEVWAREVERIHKNSLENLYLTEFEKMYQDQFNISLEMLISKFVSLTREDYLEYANASDLTAYHTAAKSDISTVYYHPNSEFFKVSHILVQYDDAQKKVIDQAKSDYQAGYISNAEYQAILSNMTASIRATEKDFETGLATGNKPLASEVLANLNNELAGLPYEEQVAIFNRYIYEYNQDPGIMNATKPYVVGLTQSDMVQAFTDASRALNQQNQKGAISGLVATEYGVHIIMFLGRAENLVTISNIANFNENTIDIAHVFNTKIYDLNNKTMLDQIYDLVKVSSSTSYQTMLINQYRANAVINKFEFRYADLWK